jgi:hypothetical protein
MTGRDVESIRENLKQGPQLLTVAGRIYTCYAAHRNIIGAFVATLPTCHRTFVVSPVQNTVAEVVAQRETLAVPQQYVSAEDVLTRLQSCTAQPDPRVAVTQTFAGGLAVPDTFVVELQQLLSPYATEDPRIERVIERLQVYLDAGDPFSSRRLHAACGQALGHLMRVIPREATT